MTTTGPRCGNCGSTEDAHRGATPDETEILLTLLGCTGYAVCRGALAGARATTHTTHAPLCTRCAQRGHTAEDRQC